MGGYGSGRWGCGKSDAKTLVEDCRTLDMVRLVRDRSIRAYHRGNGTIIWSRNGEKVASIGYEVNTGPNDGTIRLHYTSERGGEEKILLDYTIPLTTIGFVAGGRQWWFRCNASRNNGPSCGRRVRKLYLPPRGRVFACRHCHDLAYRSNRESRKWDGVLKELGMRYSVKTLKSVMNRNR